MSVAPSQTDDLDQRLAQLVEQAVARLQRGESVDAAELALEDAELGQRLAALWPTIQTMAQLGSAASFEQEDDTSPARPAPDDGNRHAGPPELESSGVLYALDHLRPERDVLPSGILGDYRIVRELGRGGMGVVYEAEQISLSRRVALKVLPFAAMLDPRALARFKNEAQAAALIDHPNIVDVYAVGFERGVHYYAMRLIDGQTLAEVIEGLRGHARNSEDGSAERGVRNAEYGQNAKPAGGGGSSETTLPQLNPGAPHPDACTRHSQLSIPHSSDSTVARLASTQRSQRAAQTTLPAGRAFYRRVAELGIAVAEALEHAHEQGIIHRDIKPSNLILDSRGKIWVTDLGLAHVESAGQNMTRTGDLLGTLRYMSPEQALGNRPAIDCRTDIYSLGASLYELLTHRPVFEGSDRQELLRKIASEDAIPPRQIARGVPVDLETIIVKAINKSVAERYESSQALADDLRRFLDHQPIHARPPTPLQRLRKWGARHHSLMLTVAAALVAMMVTLGATIGWVARDRVARRLQGTRDARSALRDAAELREQKRLLEALAAASRAESILLASGSGDALGEVRRAQAELKLLLRLEEVRAELSADPQRELDFAFGDVEFGRAFRACGVDIDRMTVAEAASALRGMASPSSFIDALDDWSMFRRKLPPNQAGDWKRPLQVAQAVDDHPWRREYREHALQRDPRGKALAAAAPLEELSLRTLNLLGLDLMRSDPQRAVEILRFAHQRHPEDYLVNLDLAHAVQQLDPPLVDDAVRFASAAVAVRPTSAPAWVSLAVALGTKGDNKQWKACLERAMGINPRLARAYDALGMMHAAQRQYAKAIGAYMKAIQLRPDYAWAYYNLGVVYDEQGETELALNAYRRAIAIAPFEAQMHNNLGTVLRAKGDMAAALAEFERAAELNPRLLQAQMNLGQTYSQQGDTDKALEAYVAAAHWNPRSAEARHNVAVLYARIGRPADAIQAFREAVRIKDDYAEAHFHLGVTLKEAGLPQEAMAATRDALRVKRDYVEAHLLLGALLEEQRDLDGAICAYEQAARIRPGCARAHRDLGRVSLLRGHVEAAIAAFRRGLSLPAQLSGIPAVTIAPSDLARSLPPGELDTEYTEAYNDLAVALLQTGQFDQAGALFSLASQRAPDNAQIHYNLGLALFKQRAFDRASEAFRESARLRPNPSAFSYLGKALTEQGKFEEGVAAYGQAIALRPGVAADHIALGVALQQLARFDESLVALRRGHELGAHDPKWPYPSARWIAECERLAELNKLLPRIERGEIRPADPSERIELAKLCRSKRLYAAAAGYYLEAFLEDPSLAEELKPGHRYNAACNAMLAAADSSLDPDQRGRWRKQALDWLCAEKARCAEALESAEETAGKTALRHLRGYLTDPDFASLRDQPGVSQIPAAERAGWTKLWQEARALLTLVTPHAEQGNR